MTGGREVFDDGGIAFPGEGVQVIVDRAIMEKYPEFGKEIQTIATRLGGLSKRDWFAGMALCAYYNKTAVEIHGFAGLANNAYQMADAMIAERSKRRADSEGEK